MQTHFPILLKSSISPLVWWIVMIGGATVAGYPGAVLMTPLAWLVLPLYIGIVYTRAALDQGLRPQLHLLALAGAAFGLILGLIFAFVALLFMPARADETQKMVNVVVFMIAGGCIVCPLLSLLGGAIRPR